MILYAFMVFSCFLAIFLHLLGLSDRAVAYRAGGGGQGIEDEVNKVNNRMAFLLSDDFQAEINSREGKVYSQDITRWALDMARLTSYPVLFGETSLSPR